MKLVMATEAFPKVFIDSLICFVDRMSTSWSNSELLLLALGVGVLQKSHKKAHLSRKEKEEPKGNSLDFDYICPHN